MSKQDKQDPNHLTENEQEIGLLQKNTLNNSSFQIEGCYESEKRRVKYKVDPNELKYSSKPSNNLDIEEQQPMNCYPRFLQCLGSCCTPFMIGCPCLCCACCPCSVKPLFRQEMVSAGILTNWGSYSTTLKPGLHVINPISQSVMQVNLQTCQIQYQQIALSKDNVQFTTKIVLFYRIIDSLHLAFRLGADIAEVRDCIIEIAKGTIRSVIGQNQLQQIVEKRELISVKATDQMNKILEYWGIYIETVNIKELILDKQIESILSKVASTKRQSESMLINFRAQVECGRLIAEISSILSTKPAFQIRYLNMISGIISSNNDVIVMLKTDLGYDLM